MHEERLKNKGRLAEAELNARKKAIAIKGLVGSMRNLLDEFLPAEDLKHEQILDQALRLADLVAQLRADLAHIRDLKQFLGR